MFECEYCFLSLLSANDKIPRPEPSGNTAGKRIPTEYGRLQMEMTCLYEPNIQSKCPKTVRQAKQLINSISTKKGERLTQYSNTPSCDTNTWFWKR